jgi:3-dehydroquinate synthase
LVRVTVPISERSYVVVVGQGLIAKAGEHIPDLPGVATAFVVADSGVSDRWFEPLAASLAERGWSSMPLIVPPGEASKTLDVYGSLLNQLATQEAHRDDLVVGLGGGATCDVAGFVASTYMRGLPFVQVPTTLTAQVDAAIGGKTGVNLPSGKNLVGTFAQPKGVVADVETLATLSDRDFSSGLAEVAKYGLTLDADLLSALETDPAAVMAREPSALENLVARCVRAKGETVAADEKDSGARIVLNYGHTLGHALESLDGFAGRSHGEAIAVGMVFAALLSEARGLSPAGLSSRTMRLLASLGLETDGRLPPVDDVMAAFRMDKKFRGGVRFVLLEDVGRPVIVNDVPDRQLRQVLEQMGAVAG